MDQTEIVHETVLQNKSKLTNCPRNKSLCEAEWFYPEFFKEILIESKKSEEYDTFTGILAKCKIISSKQNTRANFQEFKNILSSFDIVLLQ